MSKSFSLNIPLTDELKKFVSEQSGDGTFYSTPSEYVRDLIRHDREQRKASNLRSSILEGYENVLKGKTTKLSGDLKADLKSFKKCEIN